MWTFIPNLQGQEAWQNKPFDKYATLDQVLEALETSKFKIRGLLELKPMASVDEIVLSESQWRMDTIVEAPFQNIEELKNQIKKYRRSNLPLDRIHVVYIYDLGYFIQ
jgi:hypothetical protein